MKSYPIAKSRRVRSTPYTSRIENQGVTAYTVYNHMLLPAAFGSLEESCDCLLYTSPSPRDGLLSRMPSSA